MNFNVHLPVKFYLNLNHFNCSYSPNLIYWLTFHDSSSTAFKVKKFQLPCRTSLPDMLLHSKNIVGEKSGTMSHSWYRQPVTRKITKTSFITVQPLVPFNMIIIHLRYSICLHYLKQAIILCLTPILSVSVFENNSRVKLRLEENGIKLWLLFSHSQVKCFR